MMAPPIEHQSQKECSGKEMASHHALSLEILPSPQFLKVLLLLPLWASLSPAPRHHNGQGCPSSGPLWHHQRPVLGPQSPSCQGRQTHHEQLPPPPLLTMRTLRWFLFLPLCLSCGYAFMFSSLRDKAKEPQGKVPCGGHFRIRQNLPEHTQGWLGSKWLWLIFVVLLYVILKFRGDSEKNKVRTAAWIQSEKLQTETGLVVGSQGGWASRT